MDDTTYYATIVYMNNVSRKTVATILYTRFDKVDTVFNKVLKCLDEAGHPFDTKKGQLFIYTKNELLSIDDIKSLDFEDVTIIYSEVMALNNAVQYAVVDGVTFFFHTNENNHKKFPHIHASYSGEKISISLLDYKITGSFKNKKKMRLAVAYVKDNKDAMLIDWKKWTDGE